MLGVRCEYVLLLRDRGELAFEQVGEARRIKWEDAERLAARLAVLDFRLSLDD